MAWRLVPDWDMGEVPTVQEAKGVPEDQEAMEEPAIQEAMDDGPLWPCLRTQARQYGHGHILYSDKLCNIALFHPTFSAFGFPYVRLNIGALALSHVAYTDSLLL